MFPMANSANVGGETGRELDCVAVDIVMGVGFGEGEEVRVQGAVLPWHAQPFAALKGLFRHT